MDINGLLISAGFSGRMGKPKPLLLYNDLSFAVSIILKMSTVCNRIVVVLGYKGSLVKREILKYFEQPKLLTGEHGAYNSDELIRRIDFVFNKDYDKGMFTSMKEGLKQLAHSDWVLYHFVDQPNIPYQFYSDFANHIHDDYSWIQPVYKGNKGHPIFINKKLFNSIINAGAESNLNIISKAAGLKKNYWDCLYQEILTDIDTNEEYNSLIKN